MNQKRPMRYTWTAFAFIFSALLACPAQAASPSAAFAVGQARVVVIQDTPAVMDVSIFRGASSDRMKTLVPSGRADSSVNMFLVDFAEKKILIDSGFGKKDSGLMPALQKAGLKPEDIDAVLLTHMHFDHIGGLLHDGKPAFPKAAVVASKPELDFWLNGENVRDFPDSKPNFVLAKAVADAYQGRLTTFNFGEKAFTLEALPLPGHTPGHVAFILQSEGEQLLFLGDAIHATALQFPDPEICAIYDMNMAEAVKSRRAVLEKALTGKLPVAGAHLPFPGIGMVTKGKATIEYEYAPLQPTKTK